VDSNLQTLYRAVLVGPIGRPNTIEAHPTIKDLIARARTIVGCRDAVLLGENVS
jgi:hypothetical protein